MASLDAVKKSDDTPQQKKTSTSSAVKGKKVRIPKKKKNTFSRSTVKRTVPSSAAAPAKSKSPSRSRSRSQSRSRSRSKSTSRDRKRDTKKKKKKKKRSRRRSRSRSVSNSRSRSRSRDRKRRRKRYSRSKSRSRSRSSPRSRSRDRYSRRDDRRSHSPGRRRNRSRSRSLSSRSRSRSRSRSPDRGGRYRRMGKSTAKFDVSAITNTLQAMQHKKSRFQPPPQQAPPPQLTEAERKMNDPALIDLTKSARRVYVGNLPIAMKLTDVTLREFLMATILTLGVKTPSPILKTWLHKEGTFSFIEFRSVADVGALLELMQGLQLGGRTLKISRPDDYTQPPSEFANFIVGHPAGAFPPPDASSISLVSPEAAATAAAALQATPSSSASASASASASLLSSSSSPSMPSSSSSSSSDPFSLSSTAMNMNMNMNMSMYTNLLTATSTTAAVAAPTATTVLMLLNMTELERDLTYFEDYIELVLDVRQECEKFGTVSNVIIPRPPASHSTGNAHSNGAGAVRMEESAKEDAELGPDVGPRGMGGVGRVFVVFTDAKGCEAAQKVLHRRLFAEKIVDARYYDPILLQQGLYEE